MTIIKQTKSCNYHLNKVCISLSLQCKYTYASQADLKRTLPSVTGKSIHLQ